MAGRHKFIAWRTHSRELKPKRLEASDPRIPGSPGSQPSRPDVEFKPVSGLRLSRSDAEITIPSDLAVVFEPRMGIHYARK